MADPNRKPTLLVCVLLALLTATVYLPVAKLGFINFDDADYVSGNPQVQAGLTAQSVKWAFVSLYASNWHPLTWLSHMLDCQLYGLKPGGHHLTNLLLHITNSLLLFGLLKRLTGAFWRSAIVAGLFALHPLHVESVAWISERKDVLSGFFLMLTLWAYARYVQCGMRSAECGMTKAATQHATRNTLDAARSTLPRSLFYVLSLTCFALGLMSKPMLVTLPFILLLLDYWPLGRMSLGERVSSSEASGHGPGATPRDSRFTFHVSPSTLLPLLWEKVPFFAFSALSCVMTFLVQRACGAMVSLEKGPLEVRVANAVIAYVRYLSKTFWPSDLTIFYPYTRYEITSLQVLMAALLLLAITVGAVVAYRRAAFLPVGWFWFVGMLVPVVGLVQVGKQSMADRYTYLPHIGLFIAAVWGVSAFLRRFASPTDVALAEQPAPGSGRLRGVAAAVICGLTLLACTLLTARQLSYWRDTRTLFGRAADVTERNYVAYAILGNDCVERGNLPEAIEWCRKSLEIAPDYSEAHNTLGNIYAKQGKYDEAVIHYQAAAADLTYADPRVGLADVLVKQGKLAEAEAQCREALRLAPMHLPALYALATALHSQGKLEEAGTYYGRIVALSPHLFTPHRLLGNVLLAQGKAEQAAAQFHLAIGIRPGDADTRVVLGMALLDLGRTDAAAAQLMEAARLQPTNAIAFYQLARVHQLRKETGAAVGALRQALKAQPNWPESLNDLAWILAANADASVRNGKEAVALAERACELTSYKEPLLVGTLAAAYAEAGRFPDAVTAAEKARAIALAAGQKEIAQRNQELLELYRAGKPYHEP